MTQQRIKQNDPRQPNASVAMTPLRQLFSSSVVTVLVAKAAVMTTSNGTLALVPLLGSTSVANGGLGLSLGAVGSAFFWRAIIGTTRAPRRDDLTDHPVQVMLFPRLADRIGSVRVLQFCAAPGYLILPGLWPAAVLLARGDHRFASDAVFYSAMILWSWANSAFTSAS